MICEGNGDCLKECNHKEHGGYCPTKCCSPVECRNYKYCKQTLPNWIKLCRNGMDMNCVFQMGPHIFTNIVEDCCICLDNKRMILLKCKHRVCNDCWFNITKEALLCNQNPVCPLCRNPNFW